MSREELIKLAEGLQSLEQRRKYNQQEFLFPDKLRADYHKHWEFMDAGKFYKERALIAGNRVGKTYTAMGEASFHLNGRYPEGWKGKKFQEPINCWAIGKTHETTRDILQTYLIGPIHDIGSGMLPKEDIDRITTKSGIQDAKQDVYIKHYTDGIYDGFSHLQFKSYIQGIDAFMGTAQHLILLDEEPPRNIYGECLMRTMTTNGSLICTFTPLEGISEVVESFMPNGKFPMGGAGPVE
jgi:phage terminase large subunit-like protein